LARPSSPGRIAVEIAGSSRRIMMRRLTYLCAGILSLAVLTGCGGGGPSEAIPPIISSTTVARDANGIPNVSVFAVDTDSGIASVDAVYVDSTGSEPVTRRVQMTESSSGTAIYMVSLPTTAVSFTVEARDKAGNLTMSESTAVPPPSIL
jgi:hypothetical protein